MDKYKEGLKLINDGEIAKGIKALEEAAVGDNADAQKALVNIYAKGIGVQANHDKASLYAKELVKNNVDGAIDLVKEILASLKDNKTIYLK